MPHLREVERLFSGWRATITRTPLSLTVTVPLMSEGAARVLCDDIRTNLPAVYRIETTPTESGGFSFELFFTRRQGLATLVQALRSRGLTHLEPQLDALLGEDSDTEKAALLGELGVALEESREFDLACRAYQASIDLEPENLKVRFNLATLLLKLGEPSAAVTAYRELLSLEPTFEAALYNLAMFHLQGEETNLARDLSNRLLTAHPGSALGLLLAAEIDLAEQRLASALERLLAAVELEPDLAEAHYRAAQVMRQLEAVPEALDQWRRYRELVGSIPENRYLPVRLLVGGEPDGAEVVLDRRSIGQAPVTVPAVRPGLHLLSVLGLGKELTIDLPLEEGTSYRVRHDLPALRVVYEPASLTVKVTLPDGRERVGAELVREYLAKGRGRTMDQPVTPADAFALILEECLKDGELSRTEEELILTTKQLLRIDASVHQRVFGQVRDKLKARGRQGSEADPEEIYRIVFRAARADGQVGSVEMELLGQLGRFLEILPARRRQIETE